jgi:cytochrome c-type biogenesis protein CcmH/NrfF
MNPTLYEGTVSLWPMLLAALVLWVVVIINMKRGK